MKHLLFSLIVLLGLTTGSASAQTPDLGRIIQEQLYAKFEPVVFQSEYMPEGVIDQCDSITVAFSLNKKGEVKKVKVTHTSPYVVEIVVRGVKRAVKQIRIDNDLLDDPEGETYLLGIPLYCSLEKENKIKPPTNLNNKSLRAGRDPRDRPSYAKKTPDQASSVSSQRHIRDWTYSPLAPGLFERLYGTPRQNSYTYTYIVTL